MAAEGLVQVEMSVSTDFASRGERVWVTAEHAAALRRSMLARVIRTAEVADGAGAGEGDGEPAGGDSAGRTVKRARGSADS